MSKLKIQLAGQPAQPAIQECVGCRLSQTRRNVVCGRGALPCDILFVGEAPGTAEDLLGEAFVGVSGKLLDAMIEEAELFGYKIYFTNCVFCRPTDSRGGENRPPKADEVLSCSGNVNAMIDKAGARLTVLVGETAKKYYGKISPSIHIQHPAYILRTGGKASPFYISNCSVLKKAKRYL